MIEPTMPTTLPSPVDRREFQFFAVDADGREWQWDDYKMVWVVAESHEGGTRHEPR